VCRIFNKPFGIPTFVSSVKTTTIFADPLVDFRIRFSPSRPVMSPLTLTFWPFDAPNTDPKQSMHNNAVQLTIHLRCCFINLSFRELFLLNLCEPIALDW